MNRLLVFTICLALFPAQSHGDCNVTTLILAPITNNIYTWPCGTTVRYFQGSYPLPGSWMTEVGSGAIGWDAATGKIGIAPLSGLPPDPLHPFGTVEWQGITTFWPGDSGALGDTTPWIGTLDPISRMAPLAWAVVRINLYNYRSEPDLINNIPADWVSEGCQAGKYSFKELALHEWGHAIGFFDTTDDGCIGNAMYKTKHRNECLEALGPIDIAAAAAKYACTAQERLDLTVGAACSCYSGPQDVAIRDFRCVDGVASWYSLFEDDTKSYTVESSDSKSGPWKEVAFDVAGSGEHKISLAQTDKFVRLVEIDDQGEERIQGFDRARTSDQISEDRNRHLRNRPQESSLDHVTLAARVMKTTSCTSWAAVPDYVIFTTGPLYNQVNCRIGQLRESQGYHVRVIDLSQVAPSGVAEFVRSTIHDYYYQFGTKYFHLVGTWTDDLSSALWQTSDYWRAKRNAFLKAGAAGKHPAGAAASLPPFLLPSNGAVRTAASTPYAYSDRPYADVDNDGVPDVVVTRWPFTTTAQVQGAYDKLVEYDTFPKPSKVLFLGFDQPGPHSYDHDWEVVQTMVQDETERLSQVAPNIQSDEFLWSTFTGSDWNQETADRINGFRPDIICMSSTNSASDRPCGFFSRQGSHPWEMSMLDMFVYSRLVVAASCDAADYEEGSGIIGDPVCTDFLGEPYLGTMEWVGPTGSSIAAANHLVTMHLIEKLNYNPYRPMAESWLLAMRLAYADVLASPNPAALLPTLDSYVFLGDPLAPFAPTPSTTVSTFVENSVDHVQRNASSVPLVSCPKGDGDKLIVRVDMNAGQVVPYATASNVTLTPPPDRNGGTFIEGSTTVFQKGTVSADNLSMLNSSTYRATFTVANIGGSGADSAQVSFFGVPVGWARFKTKSYDLVPINSSAAKVDLPDLADFSAHYSSSVCNCIQGFKPYSPWPDVVKGGDPLHVLPDTTVGLGDWVVWSPHYGHQYSSGQQLTGSRRVSAVGDIAVDLEEDWPVVGQRKLHATVRLEGVEPFKVMLIALKNEDSRFQFVNWQPVPGSAWTTMAADVPHDGTQEIMIGVSTDGHTDASTVVLGSFDLNVMSDQPLALNDDDLGLVFADLLTEDQSERSIYGTAQSFARSLTPARFMNQLAQNYPNPFNPQTTLAYSIAKASDVALTIYDVNGRRVRELVNQHQQPGVYKVVWDGTDAKASKVASGVYFYKLVAGSFTETKKMIVLK